MLLRLTKLLKFNIKQKKQYDVSQLVAEKTKVRNQRNFKNYKQKIDKFNEEQLKKEYAELFYTTFDRTRSLESIKTQLMNHMIKYPIILAERAQKQKEMLLQIDSQKLRRRPKILFTMYNIELEQIPKKERGCFDHRDFYMKSSPVYCLCLQNNRRWTPLDIMVMRYPRIEYMSKFFHDWKYLLKLTSNSILNHVLAGVSLLEYKLENNDLNIQINLSRAMMPMFPLSKFDITLFPLLCKVVYELNRISSRIMELPNFPYQFLNAKEKLKALAIQLFLSDKIDTALKNNKLKEVEVIMSVHLLISIYRKDQIQMDLKNKWISIISNSEIAAPNNNTILLSTLSFLRANKSFEYIPNISTRQLEDMRSLKNLQIFWDYLSGCDQQKVSQLKQKIAEKIVYQIRQARKSETSKANPNFLHQSLILKISNNAYRDLIEQDCQ